LFQIESGIQKVVYRVLQYLFLLMSHAISKVIGLEHCVGVFDCLVYVLECDVLSDGQAHVRMIGLLTLVAFELLLELLFM
jgi:hypothetical protein